MKKIKLLIKKYWNLLLSKTTVDEKVIEVHKEVKRRAKRVKEELSDVGEAIGNVADQVGDVAGAVKGKTRKGRKPRANKNKL